MTGNNETNGTDGEDMVASICADHGNQPAALIEILHHIQRDHGYIAEEAISTIAQAVNLSRAEVHGVVSFYHDFRRELPGRHILRFCRAESCQANGCEAVARHAESTLNTKFGATTEDGAFTLKAVYCLGNCALGPTLLIGEDIYGRVDTDRFDEIIRERRRGDPS